MSPAAGSLDTRPGEFRALLGFASRDLSIPGVVGFAEVVASDRWLRPDQRQLLNVIYDHMVTANRHTEQHAQAHAEQLAERAADLDHAAIAEAHAAAQEQAQQHAEAQAERRAADDAAVPATTTIDPATSVTYDELPDPGH